MKQIKGEPWPPGETLAGSRDGIQMGNHEGIIQGFWDLFFPHNNLIIIKVCFVFCIIKNRIFKKWRRGGGTKMQNVGVQEEKKSHVRSLPLCLGS